MGKRQFIVFEYRYFCLTYLLLHRDAFVRVEIRKFIYILILKLMLLSNVVYSADLEINVTEIQQKAALNQKQALFDLGYLTQTGQGVEQDLQKAIETI